MCGLSGVMSSTVSWQEEGMFRDLLNISSLRGSDGSGVIVSQAGPFMKPNPMIRSLRTTEISGKLAYSGELDELLKPRVNAIIGHARWPTKGGVDLASCHPHRSGHIIGVHNGTMYRVNGEAVKDKSDSAMLFESIAAIGVEETIKESDGAYALIWVDETDNTINFLRNEQRTLYFKNIGWQKNISTMFWASEQSMLDFVFKRTFKGENTWDTYLPPHKWFKYPLAVGHKIETVGLSKEVKPKERSFLPHTGRGRYTNEREIPWVHQLALPPPLSKQEQKRRAKAVAKEAAKDALLASRFPNLAEKVYDIKTPLTEAFGDGDDITDVPVGVTGERYLKVEGKPCAWCGTVACQGDRVIMCNPSDLGDKTFICYDCGRNPDVLEFTNGCVNATVIF